MLLDRGENCRRPQVKLGMGIKIITGFIPDNYKDCYILSYQPCTPTNVRVSRIILQSIKKNVCSLITMNVLDLVKCAGYISSDF